MATNLAAGAHHPAVARTSVPPKRIWIDLDNSPHVPFFAPIIEELEKRGYSILITARDCFQVRGLADLLNVRCKWIGRHYGKSRLLKMTGLCVRAGQLAPEVLRGRPDLALSHGSRSQMLLAMLLRIPSMVIFDYEFVAGLGVLHPTWLMAPDVIEDVDVNSSHKILKYPGIKEDVYVPRFRPNRAILSQLGIRENELVVTLRPPANEAHYHNPESEELLGAVIRRMAATPEVRAVLLARNERQEDAIRAAWKPLFDSGKILVPPGTVDGLNLIWHSELVISGGGTMNREAAALGVPVYSIFRGHIGAVDKYLAGLGRLTLLKSVEDVETKIVLQRRARSSDPKLGGNETLKRIVENVISVVEKRC
jgi:predicted glycosyltransferase